MRNHNDYVHARSEAALYAEGTPFNPEELYRVWLDQDPEEDEILFRDPVSAYERFLREHPRFTPDWLE